MTLGLSLSAQPTNNLNKPQSVLPIPQEKQVSWQQLETYAFIHFGLNTFTGSEWGYGNESPSLFNPTQLDTDQWARTCKQAGMKGIIFTAKHHDGFCLWPTPLTDYNISKSPYKDGKGDLVREVANSCKKYNLKFGIYLSPWDRHQASYGSKDYLEYYYAQLEDLLSNYGDIFEVWFDGANGGDGYYGGAMERRNIDRRTYYDFNRLCSIVERLQPNAVIFSDGGPGCRWVGNEKGYAHATNWSFLREGVVYPGYEHFQELQEGHADGNVWVAAECNTSIRPGWFYHVEEDDKVKSVDHLVDLYYRSVGHNGTFLLNFPVDKRGLIHENDSAVAAAFYERIKKDLANNLLLKARFTINEKPCKKTIVKALTDGDFNTYCVTNERTNTNTLTFEFKKPTQLNRLMLQENIRLGQRVKCFIVEYMDNGAWKQIDCGEETTTIGYKRLLRFNTIETKSIRIRFVDSRGEICISEIGAFFAED